MSKRTQYGGYYTPRITFTCSEEQLVKSQKLFPRVGLRGEVMTKYFDWLIRKMETHGESVATAIAYSGKDFATLVKEIEMR